MGATGLCLGVQTGREIGLAEKPRHGAGTRPRTTSRSTMNTEVHRDTAIKKRREVITPGANIYVVLRRKNKLGTCRWLEFYHVRDGELKRITWDVALAVDGEYCREHDAVKVTGSGLDVGFASVDSLGQALFGNGRALKHQWL